MKPIQNQILAAIPLLLIEFMQGIGMGWLAPMLDFLKNSPENAFTSENCAWIAALHYVTRGIFALVSILMIDRLGRNFLLVISASICCIMWIIVYWSRNVYVHYFIRLLYGINSGFNDTASGIYIGENCTPRLRGILSSLYFMSFFLGELIEFLLAAFLSYEWVSIVNFGMGFAVVLSIFLLKEPPQYLIMRNKMSKAERNYDHLHDLQKPKSKREFEDMKQYVLEQRKRTFSIKILFSREAVKSIRIVWLMHLLCYLCGYTAINSFITMALGGSTGLSKAHLTIFFGAVLTAAVLLSSPFIERFNRRTLYLYTSGLILVLHIATATLYYVDTTISRVQHFQWILFFLLTTFMSTHGMFIFPVTTVIRSEILPQNVKAIGSSLGMISGSLGGFLSAKVYLPIAEAYGMYVNYVIFSFFALFMFLYVYFDLPETRGKTLVEIQRELTGVATSESMEIEKLCKNNKPL